MTHEKPKFDSVPTPSWFLSIFETFHDPYPLGCTSIIEPPRGTKIFCNPGYSRKEEAAKKCIEWHRAGHFVALLVPIESSTKFAKILIEYGCERIYFERRIFPNCRGVELIILTGGGGGLPIEEDCEAFEAIRRELYTLAYVAERVKEAERQAYLKVRQALEGVGDAPIPEGVCSNEDQEEGFSDGVCCTLNLAWKRIAELEAKR